MADDEHDLWDTLNLQPGASLDEVRVAFRELSRLYHPDKRGPSTDREGENAAFVRVHRAYRILSDEALRGFYEKYGLTGVRLAESLETDEEGHEGAVSLMDDRLKDLELRVRRLVRKHEELRAQRLLALNGSFLLSFSAAPVGNSFRRRFRLHYSALSHSVQIHLSERFCLTVGGASHVQSSSGAGAAKLMLAANTSVIPGTNVRTSLNVTGTSPEGELSVSRSLSPHCFVQQKFGLSRDGRYMSLMMSPWLTRTIRGSLIGTFSSDPSLSFSVVKTSLRSGHRARVFCDLQPDSGEVGVMFKYKPVKGFSMKLCPTLSRQGIGLQLTCTKASDDALSKLHWALQVRQSSLGLRLTLCRCGLRFVLPVELWSEASGPLSASDFALALGIWAAPPFILSLLRGGWLAACGWVKDLWCKEAEKTASTSNGVDLQQDVLAHRQLLSSEAAKRRREEEAINGLVILEAHYGAEAKSESTQGLSDVTDCLMARVRHSQLQLSNTPKSTLLGFGRHQAGARLSIQYRFGGQIYTRSFGETDVVILP